MGGSEGFLHTPTTGVFIKLCVMTSVPVSMRDFNSKNASDTAKRKPMPWTMGLKKLDHSMVRN